MFDALTYEKMIMDIQDNSRKTGIINDTIGVLITRPELVTGKIILPSLEYFHYRSGYVVNFYLPGFGAYWNDEYPDKQVVTSISGTNWYFSNKEFASFIESLEFHSHWSYSGESELLLVELKNGILSFENFLQFNLDNMIRDKVIQSIPQFFESLFRICKDQNTLPQLNNSMFCKNGRQIYFDKISEKLPLELGKIITQKKYFRVHSNTL